MRCSWKSMVLLALASIAIQYTAIRTFSANPLNLLCSVGLAPTDHAVNCSLGQLTPVGRKALGGCDEAPSPTSASPSFSLPAYNSSRRTHILILATTRSGSSFVRAGHTVTDAQHRFPFHSRFEPLYHVQLALLPRLGQSWNPAERRVMMGAARDLLRSLFHCHLDGLEGYIQPRPARPGRSLCLPPVCEGECVRRCGPLSLSVAAEACRAKRHAAIKTVRIPQISDLRALLEDPKLNLKVVQLVRDPRGILASRIETFRDTYRLWRHWRATGRRPHNLDLGQINTVCEDFLHSVSTSLAKPPWLKGRYMLLRYEDLARFPLQKARELYSFLGLVLHPGVEDWITNNTRGSNSAANAENWRVKLSFDMVAYTQTACQPLLGLLGYKAVFHPRELRNLSHSLVEDRTFPPVV
uniref:Sulfotransferase n=1 Tax=Salarias fasciatus TaxID=181472 RepID=A0A672JKP7_SALFA